MADTPERPTSANDLPVFPLTPDGVRMSSFRPYEKGDFPTDTEVEALIESMWKEPDTKFYYYFPTTEPAEERLLAAQVFGLIHLKEMERHYYRHPDGGDKDFFRVAGPTPSDWQRAVVDKGPEYWRVTLRLSSRKIADLDAAFKVELEEIHRERRRQANYAFDVFLSYAKDDTAEASILHSRASSAGLRIFMARKILEPGDDFSDRIWESGRRQLS